MLLACRLRNSMKQPSENSGSTEGWDGTMAEQFILLNSTPKMVKKFIGAVKCTITNLQHANVPWSPASRAEYDKMMGLNGAQPILNRAGLPPHFYIEIGATIVVAQNDSTDLVRSLSRGPKGAGDGDGRAETVLKALDAGSRQDWWAGYCFKALNNELQKGNVSISLFHFNGHEVDQADRDTVNGYPKVQ